MPTKMPGTSKKSWKKKVVLGLSGVVGLIGAAIGAVLIYGAATWDRRYDLPLPAVSVSKDPAVLARGEYLVRGPAHCVMCHVSSFDEVARAARGEPVALAGGLVMDAAPLGRLIAPNLTPDPETGIGRWSDGQIARVLRTAVLPHGQTTIQPLMPFGDMSDQDVSAIISYLRAQPPVRNAVPPTEYTLVGKTIKALAPTFKPRLDAHPQAVAAAEGPTPARGQYLARNVANCVGCHTPRDPLSFAATGPEFSGGMEIQPIPMPEADPKVWFHSPNLTPQPSGALAKFPDRASFVARFKLGGRQHAGSPMPWEAFRRMSDDDLGAIYEFLRGLPAAPGPTGEPSFRKS